MVTRMTLPLLLVLQVFLEEPGEERYGLEISEAAGLASGSVHPILARLEAAGWVVSRWEDVEPTAAGRPARRYYKLTSLGRAEAHARMAKARRVPVSAGFRRLAGEGGTP